MTGQRELKPIKETTLRTTLSIMVVELENGAIFEVTPEHRFFVGENWVEIQNLNISDELEGISGVKTKIKNIGFISKIVSVYNFEVLDNENYFIGEDGLLVHNGYRETFFEKNPSLKGEVVVHHAVEQQVLKKYPGLFTKEELDKINNLRGIPNDLNNTVHLSTIRVAWNRFYKKYPNATKEEIQEFADAIDGLYGSQFNPPLK